MIIGNKTFDNDGAYIMGILNVTPDSFFDGGKYQSVDLALKQVERMIFEGASIIDIGAESTRPNHTKISDDTEIERLLPILEKLKSNFDIPISLDSYKSKVVSSCVDYIDMVNDVWGLKYDDKLADVIAKNNLSCCIMHNSTSTDYNDFMNDVISDLKSSIDIAKKAGISDDKIMVDGGVGFAKSYEQNLAIINNTTLLKEFNYPVLIAVSNKSVVGLTLDVQAPFREVGNTTITTLGLMQGASFFRVHNVKANMEAIKMTKSVLEEKKWTV